MAQSGLGNHPSTDQIIKSLKGRLDYEAIHTKNYMDLHSKVSEELSEVTMKFEW